jgi:hypothetical protein
MPASFNCLRRRELRSGHLPSRFRLSGLRGSCDAFSGTSVISLSYRGADMRFYCFVLDLEQRRDFTGDFYYGMAGSEHRSDDVFVVERELLRYAAAT